MIEVTKSNAKGKKYTATLPSGKKVHFGAKGYQDYTQHGDEARRKNYLARHGGGGQDWGIAKQRATGLGGCSGRSRA